MDIYEQTYLNIINESNAKKVLIEEISKDSLRDLIDSRKIEVKNRRFKLDQISKYFVDTNPNVLYYVLKENGLIKAICVVNIKENVCYIKQIGSIESGFGYGKKLLDYFLNQPFKMIYLCTDWVSPEKLLNYYRNKSFYLKEYKNPVSNIHWFYKNRMLPFKTMDRFIEKYFI